MVAGGTQQALSASLQHLPEAATMGPTALPRAPRLRRMPMIVPFCPGEPEGRGLVRCSLALSYPEQPLGEGSHHSWRPRWTDRVPQQQQLVGEIWEAPVSSGEAWGCPHQPWQGPLTEGVEQQPQAQHGQ